MESQTGRYCRVARTRERGGGKGRESYPFKSDSPAPRPDALATSGPLTTSVHRLAASLRLDS